MPGREIRLRAGEQLDAVLRNDLPEPTTLHWHGVALRNDADGVPGVTQAAVAPGASHRYRFTAPHPGTYWFHPHVGTQQDRGLYGALVVEDPHEPLAYDEEWTVVLDDWLDGVTGTPDEVLRELRRGMDMSHPGRYMLMGATSLLLGGDAGDVRYPLFLLNGRTADAPDALRAKPGTRVRLRIVNAGGDTAFRVALGGHRLRVTHADGFPVEPVDTDALLLGMGERYDVLVTLADGVFPLVALAEGKGGAALGIVRTGAGRAPSASTRPAELERKVLGYRQLAATPAVRLARRRPDRTVTLRLAGSMSTYEWTIDGRRYDPAYRIPVEGGERVRLRFVNETSMWHPMHLHGHSFALGGAGGPRKDTAIVLPNETVVAEFDADNPGLWMIHCHNVYHAESGMMTVLGYRA
ncbi:multicopper oxidase family protein [Actinocatenispora rupis]|uniref:Putative oxidase (Copper-binding protein) n=1 Tax=Actinocatenispora rupis TaxID=519421 RepID=A0A8J3J3T0_9ACTN|nr:putative oxidase (copper-binding protein) [Actinocatenispora rupis]